MGTFRDFVEAALYDPVDGFYARRRPTEDFYTAPELHPAFASAMADELVERLDRTAARRPGEALFVVEMGCGRGTLARQILRSLRERHPRTHAEVVYVLVERVEKVLLEAVESLRGEASRVLAYQRLADVPAVSGVFLSNELVDALPFHVLEKRDGRVLELYAERGADGWSGRLGEPSCPELAHAAKLLQDELPEGGRHAVRPEARRWMREVASRLKDGAVVTVDYGERGGLHAPRFFHRHATGTDVFARVGEQDLTASVDFSELEDEGRLHGLETARYGGLGRWLLDRGTLERLPAGDDAAAYAERNRIKTLLLPGGMGEAFKVLVQERRP